MLSLINGPGFSLLHASINQKTHKLVIRPRLYLRQLANVAKALFGLRPILIPNISGHLLNQFFFSSQEIFCMMKLTLRPT